MRDPRPGDLWSKRTNGGVIVRNVEAVGQGAVVYRNEGGFDLHECLLSTWRMWVRSGAGLDYEGPEPPSGSPVASDEREAFESFYWEDRKEAQWATAREVDRVAYRRNLFCSHARHGESYHAYELDIAWTYFRAGARWQATQPTNDKRGNSNEPS